MRISTNIRNWGDGSEPDTLIECARAAEEAGIGTVWVNDRLSTPASKGWIAAGIAPPEIADPVRRLAELAAEAGKAAPEIIAMKTLPLEDPVAAEEQAAAFAAAGVHELVHAGGYPDAAAYRRRLDVLGERIIPVVSP